MKIKLISLVASVAMFFESSGLSFLPYMAPVKYTCLRPAAFENSRESDDYGKKIIIDTNGLGLKKKDKITVQEMLDRFSKKHPELLKDPLSVLVVMRQEDARLTFKTDFNNAREHPVRKGEAYRIAYMHRRLIIDTKLPLPRGIWVSLGGLVPREKESFEKVLSAIGKLAKRKEHGYASLLTERWIEKEKAEGISRLEFAKKLLVYYYKSFEYKPDRYEDDVEGLYYTLSTLMQDGKVESFLSQLIKCYYCQGEDAIVEDSRSIGEKVYIDEFDFLLSLFIGRDDADIHSIAIHAVMDAAGFEKGYGETYVDMDESRLPFFAQAMMHSDKISLSRALILRLLQNDSGEKLFTRTSAASKAGFLKDPFMQALVKELFRLDRFEERDTETGIRAFGQSGTMDRLARVIYTVGETAVSDFMDMVLKEEDRDIAEKMAYFLDRLSHLLYVTAKDKHIQDSELYRELSRELSRKWVDVVIYLAKKHKIFLKQTYYLKGMVEDSLDYRRGAVEDALIPLLEEPKRDDIWFILDLLSIYKFDRTQQVVISRHLKKDSPQLKAALKYLYRLKDPKSFDDVWRFLLDIESSKRKIRNEDLIWVGRYLLEMLNLKDGAGLSDEQRQSIREFAERHILNQDLSGLLKDLSDEWLSGDLSTKSLEDESRDYTDKVSFIRVWLSLAGIFNRDDMFNEIMKAAEKSLKFLNILDVTLEALLSLASEESYQYLRDFAVGILLAKKEPRDTVIDPEARETIKPKETVYKTLQRDLLHAHPERRRRLLIDMIDLAILNESKEVFDGLLHTFISVDPKGALDTLKTGKWLNVDLSNIDPDPLDRPKISGVGEKIYSFKGLREYFLSWYVAYIKRPELADELRLVDDEESFWERLRFGIRVLLLIELGLIGDEEERHKAKIEFLIESAFKHSGFIARIRSEERLSALVALKPVVDIANLDIEMPKSKTKYREFIWEQLLSCDPTFYGPLKKEINRYLTWLIKNKIITWDHKTALDKFGAYFLKKGPSGYEDPKLCGYEKAGDRMEKFEGFLRKNVLQFFYPEETKPENKYDFSRQLLYTLVSIFSKLEQQRKDSSVDYEPVWAMFLLPEPDAIVVRALDIEYPELVGDIMKELKPYLGPLPKSLPSKNISEAINSSA